MYDENEDFRWGKFIGICVLILFGLIVFFSTLKVVGAGERGVVTRFGKINRTWEPGVHIKAPFIEGAWVTEVRVQKEQVDSAAASKDLQEVKSTLALNYHLQPDKVAWIYQNLGVEYKERVIDPSIQESFKAVTAQFDASQLLQDRPKVKDTAKAILEERLHKNFIIVDDLSIVNFDFSDAFNQAIEAKQVAQQNAEQANYKLEQAKKDAEAMKVQAQALESNPKLTEWEAIKKWDGKLPTYVGSNMMPFIGEMK